jgi:hypothetical protein
LKNVMSWLAHLTLSVAPCIQPRSHQATHLFCFVLGHMLPSLDDARFSVYDSAADKATTVPRILGRAEKSCERSVVSPDGALWPFAAMMVASHGPSKWHDAFQTQWQCARFGLYRRWIQGIFHS